MCKCGEIICNCGFKKCKFLDAWPGFIANLFAPSPSGCNSLPHQPTMPTHTHWCPLVQLASSLVYTNHHGSKDLWLSSPCGFTTPLHQPTMVTNTIAHLAQVAFVASHTNIPFTPTHHGKHCLISPSGPCPTSHQHTMASQSFCP